MLGLVGPCVLGFVGPCVLGLDGSLVLGFAGPFVEAGGWVVGGLVGGAPRTVFIRLISGYDLFDSGHI